jgi:hypothetical protein
MSFPMSMSRTALSISSGNFWHAALAAMSLKLVMLLYAEIQARMASWVIVQTCVRLRVLFAGASLGAGFVRMPNLAICCDQQGWGCLSGELGFGWALCLTCNGLCMPPFGEFGSSCSVGGSRPKRVLAMLGVTLGCTLGGAHGDLVGVLLLGVHGDTGAWCCTARVMGSSVLL